MSSPLCDGFLCFARNDGKAYRPTITPIHRRRQIFLLDPDL